MKKQKGFVEVIAIYAIFVLLAGSHIIATHGSKNVTDSETSQTASAK